MKNSRVLNFANDLHKDDLINNIDIYVSILLTLIIIRAFSVQAKVFYPIKYEPLRHQAFYNNVTVQC